MTSNNDTGEKDESSGKEGLERLTTDGGTEVKGSDTKPMTFYLTPETKRKLMRFLKTLELDYDVVFDASKSSQYEAIVLTAMENETEVVEKVSTVSE